MDHYSILITPLIFNKPFIFQLISLDQPINDPKGRWVYKGLNVFYVKNNSYFKGKKLEKALKKIHYVIDHVDQSHKVEELEKLRDLIIYKVGSYNSKHQFLYKLFSKCIYGDINKYEERILQSINQLIIKHQVQINEGISDNELENIPLNDKDNDSALDVKVNEDVDNLSLAECSICLKEGSSPIKERGLNDSANEIEVIKQEHSRINLFPKRNFYEKQKDQQFIEGFVNSFLHPYLVGDINAESEEKDRMPLIMQLFKQIEERNQILLSDTEKKEIENSALFSYVKESIRGWYLNQRLEDRSVKYIDVQKNSEKFVPFLNVLNRALEKDFPGRITNSPELERLIRAVWIKYNIENEQVEEEIKQELQTINHRATAYRYSQVIKDKEEFLKKCQDFENEFSKAINNLRLYHQLTPNDPKLINLKKDLLKQYLDEEKISFFESDEFFSGDEVIDIQNRHREERRKVLDKQNSSRSFI